MRHILIGVHSRSEDISGAVAMPLHDLFLSALPVDETRGIAERKFVEEVARVRQELIAREIFVALRYGTTVHGSEEAEAKCGQLIDGWRRLLERWRGYVEITLKVAPQLAVSRPKRSEVASGAEYLRKLDAMRTQELSSDFREHVERELAFAAEMKWNRRGDGGWELAAMIRREQLSQLEGVASRLKSADAPPFLISGPWPLEVFANG